MEIRSFGENAAPKLLDERNIEGYAIVFERESRVMYDLEKKRFFIEIIKSGAVSEELLRSCDVKALLEHNKQRLLARSNNGTGLYPYVLMITGVCTVLLRLIRRMETTR